MVNDILFAVIPLAFVGFLAILWLWALIDILKGNFSGTNKVIWLLLVLFIPFLGMFLYFVIGRKQKISQDKSP